MEIYKGGTRPENGELLTSQQFAHPEADGGFDAIIELKEPQLFYGAEEFWVVITYPKSMPYPAAYNDRPSDYPRASWIQPTYWVNYSNYNFKVKALEQQGGYGNWLTVAPSTGEIDAESSTEVSFNIDASNTQQGGNHYAVVTYAFNDPALESAQRVVELYVNHLPEIEVLENIYVNEGQTVEIVASASDADGSIATIELLHEYEFAAIIVNGNTATITYSPDFEQAGDHMFELVVTDDQGEAVTKTINVTVGDVNRAPVAGTVENVEQYVENGAFTIDGPEVFTDEDLDELTYSAIVENDAIVSIAITSSGFEISTVAEGETMITLVASDGLEEVSTTFSLTLFANHAPVVEATMEDMERYIHDGAFTVDISQVFADEDMDELEIHFSLEGDNTLLLSFTISNPSERLGGTVGNFEMLLNRM